MGGGGGKGKSESSSNQGAQNQFQQNVWGPQGQALQQLYGQTGQLFGDTMNQMGQQIPGAIGQQQQVFDQAMPAWQRQMQGGAFAGMPLQQNYQQALQGGGNEQFINQSIMGGAGNNYAQAMKNQLAGDTMDRLGRQFAASDLRASAAGQPGSSRHGLLQADMTRQAMDRLADQQTNIGYQTFDKDLEAALNANSEIATAQGQNLSIDLQSLTINNSVNIIAVNTNTTNGVIHVIDSVLIPG